jgi:hypothetical protein
MKKSFVLPGVLLLLLPSCYFLSLQPLYSPDTVRFSKELLGIWESDGEELFWHFTEESDDSYHLILSGLKEDEIAEKHYIAHLVELDGETFLDIIPRDAEPMTLSIALPMHAVAKVDIEPDEVHFIPYDARYFRQLARSGQIELPCQVIGTDSLLVFAASTARMQQLVRAYSQDPKALPDTLVLKR